MSYEIVYGMEAIKFTADEVSHYEDKYIVVGQCGSSNCYECSHGGGNGRRSRDWTILAIGGESQVMEKLVEMAAGCEGGSIKVQGLSGGKWGCSPEQFIRKCRKTLESAVHGFDGAYQRGLSFDLRIRFYDPDEDTSPRDKRCDDYNVSELVKTRPMIQDNYCGYKYREFKFDLAEVAEWFKYANNRRGRNCAEVHGPRDPKPAQKEMAFA